jgi:hypothetical protein
MVWKQKHVLKPAYRIGNFKAVTAPAYGINNPNASAFEDV